MTHQSSQEFEQGEEDEEEEEEELDEDGGGEGGGQGELVWDHSSSNSSSSSSLHSYSSGSSSSSALLEGLVLPAASGGSLRERLLQRTRFRQAVLQRLAPARKVRVRKRLNRNR